ncbi:hypothetical protein BDZ89DRAFT_1132191 [Hymenopellis radicata]|nr:hypothetical protein BDZ89DRAFT_1132191 [Hymenopellis radicata]
MPKDPSKHSNRKANRSQPIAATQRLRWGIVTPEEAASRGQTASMRQHSGLRARSQATDVPLKKLITTTEQLHKIEALYEQNIAETHQFFVAGPNTSDSQIEAACLMASLGVDIDARDDHRVDGIQGGQARQRATRRARIRDAYSTNVTAAMIMLQPVPKHDTSLFHLQNILRIRGVFDHNDTCKAAVFTRIPPLPVHPAVYRVALAQLAQGVPMEDGLEASLGPGESRQLFPVPPVQSAEWCEDVAQTHLNIHAWLDPEAKEYNAVLADAVFHYSARAAADERFEACIATKDMKGMAWKYGHQSQILLDGTFGLCDSKLLLFILMGIDEDGHGVPLAFLFFSAPSGNKHTAAGYDTKILAKLLQLWVANTDMKERGALLQVFPWIVLLICRVHLRQSWKNHRNKTIKGKAAVYAEIRNQLHTLEDALVMTMSFAGAKARVAQERILLEASALADPSYNSGLVHLDYLENYWLQSQGLWESWAEFGRHRAASVLCCSPDKVVITTNHLESFNNVLKNHHIRRKQRGGRRLRLDVLIKFVVTDMIPSLFQQRRMERAERQRYKAWVLSLPGGDQLWQEKQTGRPSNQPLMFLVVDEGRDRLARLSFTCYSSVATELDEEPVIYTILLSFNGLGLVFLSRLFIPRRCMQNISVRLSSLLINLRAETRYPDFPLSVYHQRKWMHDDFTVTWSSRAYSLDQVDGVGIEIEAEQDEIDGSEEESECEDDNDDD